MTQTPLVGAFPQTRMRRNRQTDWLRRMVSECGITPNDLIWSVFITDTPEECKEIPTMPGVVRYDIPGVVKAAKEAAALGIPALCLFPHVNAKFKTPEAKEAVNPDNIVCQAVRAIKEAVPNLGIICDVALDPYNSDGHDGIVQGDVILNDETIDMLCQQAVVQAQAGCDIIAPSDMMDGRIGCIRMALDDAGFENVVIMSYAAKYASAYYGPFRDAVGSGGALKGDKKTYQMDPANTNEAMREVAMDIEEGADMVMVKPGMPYLDIVHKVKDTFRMPTVVYQVSGEYTMIRMAADAGCFDYKKIVLESLTSFKRAGADAIITYFAVDAARWLQDA